MKLSWLAKIELNKRRLKREEEKNALTSEEEAELAREVLENRGYVTHMGEIDRGIRHLYSCVLYTPDHEIIDCTVTPEPSKIFNFWAEKFTKPASEIDIDDMIK